MFGCNSHRVLVLAFLVLLCGHTASVAGVASERLVQGKIYYITLLKHPSCPDLVQYLGFNTKQCVTHNTVTLKPLSKPADAVWARWVLAILEERPDGSYIVQIANYWDPQNTGSGPKCLGKLNVVKPNLCKVGRDVSKVDIRASGTHRWLLRPVSTNFYQIIALARRSGCMRYLGGTGPCGALRPALFKADSGNGLQRWKIKELPTQQAALPAGEPAITSSTATVTAWEVRWQDGAVGEPEETYALKCTAADASSCFAPPVGPIADEIPRGTEFGVLNGLPADTDLLCYVVALNAAGLVCSSPQVVHTQSSGPIMTPPGVPAISTSSLRGDIWSVTWQDGEAGRPEETYAAFCVNYGAACNGVTAGNSVYGLKRGVQSADVTGLPPGKYSCYVRAENSVESVCTNPITVEVILKKAPGPPLQTKTLNVASDSWTAAWTDGTVGVPEETYGLSCVWPGQSCSAVPLASISGVPRGIGSATLKGLSPQTMYSCYVISKNTAGEACSSVIAVTTGATPGLKLAGKPTGVSNTVSGTTWIATWSEGTVGIPVETYTARCVGLGSPCDSRHAVGATQTGVPRSTKAAYVTGLPSPGTFSCYIIATNTAGNVCSEPAVVTIGSAQRAAGQPTGVSGTIQVNTWAAKWTDGAVGNPLETYTVKCVALGASCTANAVGTPATGIARGTQSGSTGDLPTGASYSCYVIAVNSVYPVCSAPVTVTPGGLLTKPGKPVVYGVSRTVSTVTLWWTVGDKGNPEEKYAVECHLWGVTSCAAAPIGDPVAGILRSAGTGTTTGLPNARLACYVIAYNTNYLADDVCSLVVDVGAV